LHRCSIRSEGWRSEDRRQIHCRRPRQGDQGEGGNGGLAARRENGRSLFSSTHRSGAKTASIDEAVSLPKAPEEGDAPTQVIATNPTNEGGTAGAAVAASADPGVSSPRAGTKIAHVIELIQRDIGATLGELIASTGWLPHTTRAALTGCEGAAMF
jgi:hypothetical protein